MNDYGVFAERAACRLMGEGSDTWSLAVRLHYCQEFFFKAVTFSSHIPTSALLVRRMIYASFTELT